MQAVAGSGDAFLSSSDPLLQLGGGLLHLAQDIGVSYSSWDPASSGDGFHLAQDTGVGFVFILTVSIQGF